MSDKQKTNQRVRTTAYLRIDEILSQRNMTGADLSRLTGLSENSICKMRDGRQRQIRLDTLEVICKRLNITPSEFIAVE